jgi:hypothetical protein
LYTHKEKRNAYGIQVEKLKERNHLEDLGVEMRIILKRIINKLDERTWTGSIKRRVVVNAVKKILVP